LRRKNAGGSVVLELHLAIELLTDWLKACLLEYPSSTRLDKATFSEKLKSGKSSVGVQFRQCFLVSTGRDVFSVISACPFPRQSVAL
jgi:hypothetical protein